MNRSRIILTAIIALIVIGGGIWLYDSVLGDTAPPSGPMTAIPLATQPPVASEPAGAPVQATLAPATAAPTVAPAATPAPATAAPTVAPAATSAVPASSSNAPDEILRYQIVADESAARFTLREDLRGQRVEVVGTSKQVAGELAVNPSDLSSAQIGVIQVNARAFATDSGNRDRAIRNFILNTDTYEFITFTPTSIEGLSGAGALNQPFTFTIKGDLTIRDITRPVTFEAVVQAESADRLSGTATTTVRRSEFSLTIPDVPFVANVDEEVVLTIDFVAAATG